MLPKLLFLGLFTWLVGCSHGQHSSSTNDSGSIGERPIDAGTTVQHSETQDLAEPTSIGPLDMGMGNPDASQSVPLGLPSRYQPSLFDDYKAYIGYSVPNYMEVEDVSDVKVGIIRSRLMRNLLKRKLAISEKEIDEITTSALIEVKLSASPADSFKIKATTSSPVQPLLARRIVRWEWEITAKQPGKHLLRIEIINLADSHGRRYQVTPDLFSFPVEVKPQWQPPSEQREGAAFNSSEGAPAAGEIPEPPGSKIANSVDNHLSQPKTSPIPSRQPITTETQTNTQQTPASVPIGQANDGTASERKKIGSLPTRKSGVLPEEKKMENVFPRVLPLIIYVILLGLAVLLIISLAMHGVKLAEKRQKDQLNGHSIGSVKNVSIDADFIGKIRIEINKLLVTSSDLEEFMIDYYKSVHKNCTSKMERKQIINLLIESTDDHRAIFENLQKWKNRNNI